MPVVLLVSLGKLVRILIFLPSLYNSFPVLDDKAGKYEKVGWIREYLICAVMHLPSLNYVQIELRFVFCFQIL